MFNIFKEKELEIQLNTFTDFKIMTKGYSVALHHKEYLIKFVKMTHKNSMDDITIDDVWIYKEWVLNRYASEYFIESALHSLRCFLKFYKRNDIIRDMIKLGRRPNLVLIEKVKRYRKANLSFREIQTLLEQKDKHYPLKTLHFWAHYK